MNGNNGVVNVGAIAASTLYRVEAYGPVAMGDLKRLYAGLMLPWRSHRHKFARVGVQKPSGLFVPMATVVDVFRQSRQFAGKIPDELARLLYSQPLWVDEFYNLVVTEGLNDLLDKRFKGSGYTAADYVGVTAATPTFAAGDVMNSHSGWTEVTAYSQGTRPALTLGTVSGGSVNNSASKATYSINGTTTIGGAFVTTNSTKGGTTGLLYGGGALAEGNRSLVNGDSLAVQVTLSATAS